MPFNEVNRRTDWPQWANFLRRHGLEGLAIWALESAGPLMVVGAQLLYAGSPFVRQTNLDGQLQSLAFLLEDGEEARAFVDYLQNGGTA